MTRAFELARRIPAWAWLAAIVACSFVFRAIVVRGIVAPFIFVDEVIWSELARGIAEQGRPLVRGELETGYSLVYPLVISPVYALFDNLITAHAAVKTLNALLMSLAAVPAYFLGRRVVGEGYALLGALMAVAIPSLAYTGTVMTENLFYPLFLVITLVLCLVLERPTSTRFVLLLVLLALGYATRVQAAALLPAVLIAPVVLAALDDSGLRRAWERFRFVYVTVVVLGLAVVVFQLARGRSATDLLGAYAPVRDAGYELGEVLRYLTWHVAELGLYVLVIPVAATIVLVARARRLDPGLQAYLAATLAIAVVLLPMASAFASAFSFRIQERNIFYLAPLLVIALLAWVERGAPRPRVLALCAAVASALLVLLIPFDRFITTSAITDTLMLLPLWSLQDRIGADWIAPFALALAVALAAAFLLVPRRYALVLPLLVLALWAVAFKPIWWGKHGFERTARGYLFQGIRTAERDWIDEALPSGARAGFLWTGRTDRLTVNQNEFFNRAVGPVYYVEAPTPGGLPETRVRIDEETGRVTLPDGSEIFDEYLVTDSSFTPAGKTIAHDVGLGVTLWRIDAPLVSATRIEGLYPEDTWSGPVVTYTRRRCEPGRLTVFVSSEASLFLEPQTVVARSNGRVVGRVTFDPADHAVLSVPLSPPRGSTECRVVFTVSPTEVPSEVTGGESPDDRELGVHFDRFRYTRAP